MSTQVKKEQIHEAVAQVYGAVARNVGTAEKPSCCGVELAPSLDYSVEELASVPSGAHLGEGSGCPVRHAGLRPGEVVIDLGAGAGIDSFLAANRVGPTGRVYGFDLTPDMVERARHNATEGGYTNTRFEQSKIESLPLEAGSADAAISNCVINLAPDKSVVYGEMFRVLRPGGRMSVADIVLRGDEAAMAALRQRTDLGQWCACVLGALREQEYLETIRAAGFVDVKLVAERPAMSQPGGEVEAVAVTITARKP